MLGRARFQNLTIAFTYQVVISFMRFLPPGHDCTHLIVSMVDAQFLLNLLNFHTTHKKQEYLLDLITALLKT